MLAFSLWEKVSEGRMRGLRPEGIALAEPQSHLQPPHPSLRATFSQREKAKPQPPLCGKSHAVGKGRRLARTLAPRVRSKRLPLSAQHTKGQLTVAFSRREKVPACAAAQK